MTKVSKMGSVTVCPIDRESIRELLAIAGKSFDGHVTQGSLDKQMSVVEAVIGGIFKEIMDRFSTISAQVPPLDSQES